MQVAKGNIGKYHEYTKLYCFASNLYDCGVQVLQLLHLECIPHYVFHSLALIA